MIARALPLLIALPACAPLDGTLSTEQLTATASGHSYTLTIFEPDALAADAPVVYLLDGDDWTDTTARIVSTLAREHGLEAPLVVGIGYGDAPNQRARDYTPPGPGVAADEGQVDVFLAFIEDDLVPFVDARWDTDPTPAGRVMAGHSFGGLGAFWGQLSHPDTIGGCIALSPSLAFGDTAAFVAEAEFATAHDDLDARIYLAAGSQEAYGMAALTAEMGASLAGRGYPSLALRSELIKGETHLSVFPEGMTRGLQFMLEAR